VKNRGEMLAQEVGLAPTPMPPSIVTGSQTRTRDEETDENIFSEANNTASQPRAAVTDENALSEANQETSKSHPAPTAAAAAPIPQGSTERTPERTGTTGDSQTEEVLFFTETTQDLQTQTESELPFLPQANSSNAPPDNFGSTTRPIATAAAVAPLSATAPQPPPSSTGTPSFHIEEDCTSEEAAAKPIHAVQNSHPAETVTAAKGVAPPVPHTRGPGHTPRGARPDSTRPPQRPPSRTSSRYGTPRVSRGDNAAVAPAPQSLIPEPQASRVPHMPRASVAQSDRSIAFQVEDVVTDATAATATAQSRVPQMPRASVAQSDRSIAFQVEDEVSDATSLTFRVEPSAAKQRRSEVSVDPGTLTDNSDIRFSVVPESQVSRAAKASVDPATNTETSEIHFDVEQSRGSRIPTMGEHATANSMTSLQFDIESTADNTRHSSISHFSIDNDEPEPVPVKGGAQAGEAAPVEEIITESEERRRAQKAEEERRKKALAERSQYMNTRPWDANAPNPRARRTSSQAAAHGREKQEAEKRDTMAKRHQDMHARPWRAGMSTSPKKQTPAEKKPHNAYDRPWRTHMATSPKKAAPVEVKPTNQRPWRTGMATTPKKKRTATPGAEEDKEWQQPSRTTKATAAPPTASSSSYTSSSATSTEESVQRAPKEVIPLLPVKPAFDAEEAAKFITPPPVLKAPLQVLGEEVEGWSETASQQRNLQAILEVMRARERDCIRLSNQLEAQESAMKHLNKELYMIRDAYVRKHGTDVTGVPLHGRREPEQEGAAEEAAGAAAGVSVEPTKEEYMLLRLYPRQTHQAMDYVAMKEQRSGGPVVSVLSDEDMSDGERDDFAEDIERWRVERQALRKEKVRLARERRDLSFQMRRGSNIKDIKLTQPTSGRGPLDRRAYGTETKVDIDGYDKLMDLRIAAQKADVEAANAKDQYENLCMIAVTMKKQHSANSRELTDAQEVQEEAKERYDNILQEIRHRVEEARPLIDKAQATLREREREAMHSDEENAQSELREYSDAILAARLQIDRAAAMADAASGDEDRMRRASTPRAGMSRAATPRGSTRPGVSPRGRANSQSNNDDVFARLTGRKSVDVQNRTSAATPKETSVPA
jgi:hypothetical protein